MMVQKTPPKKSQSPVSVPVHGPPNRKMKSYLLHKISLWIER